MITVDPAEAVTEAFGDIDVVSHELIKKAAEQLGITPNATNITYDQAAELAQRVVFMAFDPEYIPEGELNG